MAVTEPPDAQRGRGLVPGAQSPGTCLSLGLNPAPRPPGSYSLNSFQFPVSRQAPLFVPSPTPVRPPSPIPASCRGRSLSLAPRCLPTPSSFPPVSRLLSGVDFLPASLWAQSIACSPHRDGGGSPGTGEMECLQMGPGTSEGRARKVPRSPPHVTPAQTGHRPPWGALALPLPERLQTRARYLQEACPFHRSQGLVMGAQCAVPGRDPAQRRRQTLGVT